MSPSVPPPGMAATPPSPAAAPVAKPRAPVGWLAGAPLAAVTGVLAWVLLGSSTTKLDPVAQAATLSSSADGYRMHFAIMLSSPASTTPLTGTGDGSFDARHHEASISFAITLPQAVQALGGSTMQLQEIVDGTTVYMKLPPQATAALGGAATPWVRVDIARLSGVPGASSPQGNPATYDPSKMLEYLKAASDSVAAEGQQRVDGFLTTRYHADLDLGRVASALPGVDQRALSRLQQLVPLHTIPADVWIDAGHLVRRIEMTLAVGVPNGQTADLAMRIDVSAYGPQPQPGLPPPDQVRDLSALASTPGG